MKERLKKIGKLKIVLFLAVVVILTTAALIVSENIRHRELSSKLADLKSSTSYNKDKFSERYSVSFTDEEVEEIQHFFDDIGKKSFKEFKSFDEVKEILSECPDEFNGVIGRDDIYATVFGIPFSGVGTWDQFTARCRLGEPCSIIVAQYALDLTATFYYIEYNGDSFYAVEDRLMDAQNNEEFAYNESFGKYLKIESYDSDDGYMEYAFLTDDRTLVYRDVLDYYESDNEDKGAPPEYWQFYMATVNRESIDKAMLTAQGYSKDFSLKYTGFADRHPSFAKNNPMADYDKDGLLDRVYRQYLELENGENVVSAYLFLGNGNNIVLSKNVWGEYFKTCMKDVTEDGKDDICFIQYTKNTNSEKYDMTVFEYRNGNYGAIKDQTWDEEYIKGLL